jgi:hypothetical protein
MTLALKKDRPDQQIVMGEVYAPLRPDAQGEFMTAENIEKLAHDFIRSGRMGQIDVMHNNEVVPGCSVVESFIAQKDDKVFIPGSWVVGVHVPSPQLWKAIKTGKINGFSMEALMSRSDRMVEIDIPPVCTGLTSKSDDGHQHKFYVTYDSTWNFKGGTTDMVNGHKHDIYAGTHTQDTQGHSHRFSSVDNIEIVRVQ